MWSLADLCAEVLELELKKPASLRTGSWEKRPLSVDQLFYAAADAYAGLRLWQVTRWLLCMCAISLKNVVTTPAEEIAAEVYHARESDTSKAR